MKTIIKLISINLIIFILLNIFLSVFILSFKKSILSQKNYPRQLIKYTPLSYWIFYPDTNDQLFNNYTALIGDSYTFGLGDGYYNNEYDYSISHFLKKKNKNKNFVNFGVPNTGIEFQKSYFKSSVDSIFNNIDKPENIIYLFYEGNDLQDTILNSDTTKFNKKKFLLSIYFPQLYFVKNVITDLIIPNLLTNYLKKEEEKITKSNLINKFKFKKSIKGIAKVPIPPHKLSKKEIEFSLKIFEKSIIELSKITNNITVVYLPSQGTVIDLYGEIYGEGESGLILTSKKEINEKYNNLEKKIRLICNNNNINYINSTNYLKEKAKHNILYGVKDNHFNLKGYEELSNYISKNMFNN